MPLFEQHIDALSAGTTNVNSGTVIFSNSNGLSFGLSGNTITGSYTNAPASSLSITADNGSSLGSLSRLYFNNSNGVSFGLSTSNNGSATLTATVATNYQSQGAYLTTAALSGDTSKYVQNWKLTGNTAGTTSSANGTDLWLSAGNSITVSGNGQSIVFSVGAYITTADLSANSSNYFRNWKLTGNTAGTTSSLQGTDLWLGGGNGVTVSGSSNSISFSVATNYQSQGAYLTTAALSGDTSKYVQNWKLTGNTAGTTSSANGTDLWLSGGNSITVSGNGQSIVFSVGNYITTADLSANSSKYVQNWKLTGNTAGTTSSANGTDLWLSGGNSITVSGNGQSIVFSVGNYITTAALSGDTSKYIQNWKLTGNTSGTTSSAEGTDFWLSGGANITLSGNSNTIVISGNATASANINVSASNTSANLSNLVFSNSNGISFGLSASTITATVQTNYLTTAALSGDTSKYVQNWKLTGNTAGTTSSANGTDLWFSGGNSITISGNGQSLVFSVGNYITTAMLSNAATISNINLSAGATSNNLSAFVLSNSNGINFGLNGSTVTAQDAFVSYYQNVPVLVGTNQIVFNNASSSYIAPFILPFNLSASYIRLFATASMASTSFATTANTTFSGGVSSSINVVIYSMGVGASSNSLQYVASGQGVILQQYSLQANANGSQYTVSQNITFPSFGSSNSNLQTNFQFTNASFQISTGSLSNFSGNLNIDIPFASSLSRGIYWFALGGSSNFATQGTAALTVPRMQLTWNFASQLNLSVRPLGAATNSSIQLQLGNGSFTTTVNGTTASLDLSNISSQQSNLVPYFQMIRQV